MATKEEFEVMVGYLKCQGIPYKRLHDVNVLMRLSRGKGNPNDIHGVVVGDEMFVDIHTLFDYIHDKGLRRM